MRLDTTGRDITYLDDLYSETDCEIIATYFAHPAITSGQHTNGPATFWIRLPDGGVDWIRCRERSRHQVVKAWVDFGIEWFQAVDAEVDDPPASR